MTACPDSGSTWQEEGGAKPGCGLEEHQPSDGKLLCRGAHTKTEKLVRQGGEMRCSRCPGIRPHWNNTQGPSWMSLVAGN